MATHFRILAWKVPWTGVWKATVQRVTKSILKTLVAERLLVAWVFHCFISNIFLTPPHQVIICIFRWNLISVIAAMITPPCEHVHWNLTIFKMLLRHRTSFVLVPGVGGACACWSLSKDDGTTLWLCITMLWFKFGRVLSYPMSLPIVSGLFTEKSFKNCTHHPL